MGTSYFSCRRVIPCFLLVLALGTGSCAARKISLMQLKEVDDGLWIYPGAHDHHNIHNLSKDDHRSIKHDHDDNDDSIDLSQHIFFTIDSVKVGKTIPTYLPVKDPSTSPYLLSREEVDSIPFSLKHLPYLLELFSFPKDSPQAKAIEHTLRECEHKPMKGETKFCATSLESMLDLASAAFGSNTQLKVLTTNYLAEPMTSFQNYTVLEGPKDILAPKMLGCHTMPYPFLVYYCHSQAGGNWLFEVLLGGENGERIQATGICHMDTSEWNPDHASFRLLKIKPGSSPVCHFFPPDNIVWVPSSA